MKYNKKSYNINLFPWRERRQQLNIQHVLFQFITIFLISIIMIIPFYIHYKIKVKQQQEANNYIISTIQSYRNTFKEIAKLNHKKTDLESHIDVILTLERNRPLIALIWADIAESASIGITYEIMTRKNNALTISGVADNTYDVTKMMQSLKKSHYIEKIHLDSISLNSDGKRNFVIDLEIIESNTNQRGK